MDSLANCFLVPGLQSIDGLLADFMEPARSKFCSWHDAAAEASRESLAFFPMLRKASWYPRAQMTENFRCQQWNISAIFWPVLSKRSRGSNYDSASGFVTRSGWSLEEGEAEGSPCPDPIKDLFLALFRMEGTKPSYSFVPRRIPLCLNYLALSIHRTF